MARSYEIRPADDLPHHQIYQSYLNRLQLENSHLSDLNKRRLSPEQVHLAGYKTKKANNVKVSYSALAEVNAQYNLDEVPGFYIDEKTSHRTQMGTSGILIPVRGTNGQISSLIIRNDQPKTSDSGRVINKYMAFSSNKKNKGASAQQQTHCPIIKGLPKKACGATAMVTEGVLKADIATALGNFYCLGMHGLNPSKDLARVIDELEISTLIIALDAGEDENEDIIEAKIKLIRLTQDCGIDVKIALWDSNYGKGIDDVLAKSNADKIYYASQAQVDDLLSRYKSARPKILVQGGTLPEQADAGERALIAAGLTIYQRGDTLISPLLVKVRAAKGRITNISAMHPLSKAALIDNLTKVASWEKLTDDGGSYPVNAPANVAETILSRYGTWKFPPLSGILRIPTLRHDGTILSSIGYDASTSLYLVDKPDMPDIPETPTREDAENSLNLLDGLLDEFPFVDEASRSVALSALITPVVRGACSVVPMHVVSAPSAGTGKSYLLDTVGAIVYGQPCPIMAAGRNEEETEKRLGAVLMAGHAIISIDNLNGDLSGDLLCQAIERPVISVRPLGYSKHIEIVSRTTLYANGNNIRPTGDIVRRVIMCRLDARIERPELRKFHSNPFERVLSNRGAYIAAALVVVRAYIAAGMPNRLVPPLASFEDWSDYVRSALVWLDRVDPLESMKSARAEDPALQAMAEVFSVIYAWRGNQSFTARAALDYAENAFDDSSFTDAISQVAGTATGIITSRKLGQWLSSHRGRICDGLRLECIPDAHNHGARWYLMDVTKADIGDPNPTENNNDDKISSG